MTNPFVSVIIPVFNNSESLKLCLEALNQQTYPQELYEVIVVDNNSEENIKQIVSQFSQASLVFEGQRGSYAARNKGISVAQGNILAFTDSDCIPTAVWIEKGVQHLLGTPNCGLVAGKVELFFKDPKHPTAVELYDSRNFLCQKDYVENKKFGATANIFTLKDVFLKVGLFNSELKSGGDHEWGKRVFAAGYAQIYSEDASVAHPARDDLKEIQRKVIRITEGHFSVESDSNKSLFTFLKDLYWDIKPPIKGILQIFLDRDIKGIKQKFAYSAIVLSLRSIRSKKRIELYLKNRKYLSKQIENNA